MNNNKALTAKWFETLRNLICASYQQLEEEYCRIKHLSPAKFEHKKWNRDGGGGGEISIMHGNLFEKVGVNISTVYGEFNKEFSQKIPGAETNPAFFATGISVVSHMYSPLIPAMHFNTRYIETTKSWFGGGSDLTPIFPEKNETKIFHEALKSACDKHNKNYYPKFKQACDEYFYLPHRKEPRGVGGIFYDYLNTGNFEDDFTFAEDVAKAIMAIYPEIIKAKMILPWTGEQREAQLIKRGRYAEFNLLYDRGTSFGLSTEGNIEAIFMSLPPTVKWP